MKCKMIVIAAFVGASLIPAMAVPASASNGNGADQIGGEAIPVAECGENGPPSDFTFVMTGSLVGCWYTTEYHAVQETPSGIYQERGAELFVGCLVVDEIEVACGSFETTYKFTAKFGPEGEIHGRCQHPIVGGSGTGGFVGATGRVDFKDNVATGQFFYRGHVDLS